MSRSLLTYTYYDTPEGCDVLHKAFYLSKHGAFTGFIYGTFDVLMFSHPKGIMNTMRRYSIFIGPLVAMGTTFTIVTNGLQNFRGKNDELNYFLGGFATGPIVGAWYRSGTVGFGIGVVLGLSAIAKKICVDNCWTLFPEIPHMTQNAVSVKNDWTVTKDYPKTWTTGSGKPCKCPCPSKK